MHGSAKQNVKYDQLGIHQHLILFYTIFRKKAIESFTISAKGNLRPNALIFMAFAYKEDIRIMKDHTSASVIKALNGIERAYGADFCKIFQTITIDNGSEFSDYEGLEKSCRLVGSRTAVYYCHPYSAYERGSNENQNKMIRRHYPKGVSLEKVTTADTRKLEKWINNYPREIFDYYTAADIYEACVNSLLSA